MQTVATGNVHAHSARRTLLQDTLVAIRSGTSLDGCERERRGNREAIMRSPSEMVERFSRIDPGCRHPHRSTWPSCSSSTSPRSSAIATPTSRTAPILRSGSLQRSARMPSRALYDACDEPVTSRGERPARRRACAHRSARARRLLPPSPRGARAGAGVRARGARARVAAHVPPARPRGRAARSARSSAT